MHVLDIFSFPFYDTFFISSRNIYILRANAILLLQETFWIVHKLTGICILMLAYRSQIVFTVGRYIFRIAPRTCFINLRRIFSGTWHLSFKLVRMKHWHTKFIVWYLWPCFNLLTPFGLSLMKFVCTSTWSKQNFTLWILVFTSFKPCNFTKIS